MSINMDSGGTEYADHEVQVIYGQKTIQEGSGNANADIDTVEQYEPVSDRGLDSDELAELVGFHRTVSVYATREEEATTTEPGDVLAEIGLGVNLSEQEFAEQSGAQQNGTVVEDFDEGTIGQQNVVNNYSEPGVVDTMAPITIAPSAAPTTDQDISVGGPNVERSRTMFFSEKLGTGPFVDRTDDLTLHSEVQTINANCRAVVEVIYVLYWSVEEMPEGRASFSRP